MNLQLVHTLDDSIAASYGGNTLLRYVYRPDTAHMESRKPYFHPVYTLGGNLVTIFRPHDHVWHHGIAMTSAHLAPADQPPGDAENFWGGPTYVREQGYVQRDNNGAQEHQAWNDLGCDGESASLAESLRWIAHDGRPWLAEQRRIDVDTRSAASGYWQLGFQFHLTNVAGSALVFGSPTTAGRPLAGYGGLFWRGPRSFTGGAILAAGGLEGPDVMGKPAAWLAYIGAHDGNAARSTLVFVDDLSNPRYPTQWFVRNDPYGCASFAFSFDEEYTLAAGATLDLRCRILIADGARGREEIEAMARWRD
ncbi:MAG: PmoA family protein [Chloroflexi bacterium]|nr:PmoA family protein [Chloroflexota bacterium]MCL5273534.1 PmoA family protein [Chloroflexota bacterium]